MTLFDLNSVREVRLDDAIESNAINIDIYVQNGPEIMRFAR